MSATDSIGLLEKHLHDVVQKEFRRNIRIKNRLLYITVPSRKSAPIIYRVTRKGSIEVETKNGWSAEGVDYHFALSRTGKSIHRYYRSHKDIITIFIKAMLNQAPNLVNKQQYQKMIQAIVDETIGRFLSLLPKKKLSLARSISKRHGTSFFAFVVLQQHGGVKGVTWFRLKELSNSFPTLFHLLPLNLLAQNILQGVPLRKLLPFWSAPFRKAAEKGYQGYENSLWKLKLASLSSLKIDFESVPLRNISNVFQMLDFNPFVEPEPHHLAFMKWAIPQACDNRTLNGELKQIFQYVSATQFVIRSKNTLKSMGKRHDRWIRQQFEEKMDLAVGLNAPFPDPWLAAVSFLDTFRFEHVANPKQLYLTAHRMGNCLFDYRQSIQDKECQIYTINIEKSLVGAVEIKCENKSLEIGQVQFAVPSRNRQQLDFNLLIHWFTHQMALDEARPDQNDIPEDDCIEIPYELVVEV